MGKVLVKLTFGSLPEPEFSRASIITSLVCNAAIVGGIILVAATLTHHIKQEKLNATILYAPTISHALLPPPPKVRIRIPVLPTVQSEQPHIDTPKMDAPRIHQEKAAQPPEPKPIHLADTNTPVLISHSDTPRIVLAPQAKVAMAQPAQPAPQGQHGSVGGAQFGVGASQGQKSGAQVKTAAAGWPGLGTGSGGQQQHAATPVYHPLEVMSGPLPEYTPEAKQLHIQGSVVLRVSVSSTGHIAVLEVIRGLGYGLDEAAKRAVVKYHIKPALRDGVPVDQITNITISFQVS